MEQWLVIGVSGVTCSGKTTLAQSLFEHFKKQSGNEIKAGIELNRVELINQDTYFRQVDDPNHQMIEKLNHLNWEIMSSLDTNKMVNEIMEILGPKFVLYNTHSSELVSSQRRETLFQNNYAKKQQQHKQRSFGSDELMINDEHQCNFKKIVKHNSLLNILIIEGFLIFNHQVTLDLCNVKYHLHVPYEVCYARRIKRTYDPADVPCKFSSKSRYKMIFSECFQVTLKWLFGHRTRSTYVNLKTGKMSCSSTARFHQKIVFSSC